MSRRHLQSGKAWRLAAAVAAAGVLGSVFGAYLEPDLVVTLANQLWSCF